MQGQDEGSEARRREGIDQIDRTDAQGKTTEAAGKASRRQADPAGKDAAEKDPTEKLEVGEAKDGGIPGVSPLNTSGAAKGHW